MAEDDGYEGQRQGGEYSTKEARHKKLRNIRNKIPMLEVVAAAMMHDIDAAVRGGGRSPPKCNNEQQCGQDSIERLPMPPRRVQRKADIAYSHELRKEGKKNKRNRFTLR
jgi:hypothetical protein